MDPEFDVSEIGPSHEVVAPPRQTLPLVFASPHSGNRYPRAFVAQSPLDRLTLRRSEDSFVDEIFGAAPGLGAPLIRARFPRAYVDPNREPFELDPGMFADPLPSYANTRSPRVAAGLGTIARVVATGADIYRDKLVFQDALERIRRFYWPYHAALRSLVEQTRAEFGYCILIDCHSMPSAGGVTDKTGAAARIDFVLGDCHGTACAPQIIQSARRAFKDLGYRVACNAPYAGGFVTRHYGRPEEDVHALQIEINRALYMDEGAIRRGHHLPRLSAQMQSVIATLGRIDLRRLAAE